MIKKEGIIILIGILLHVHGYSQNTEGAVTFTVRTVTDNGPFSPKHVLAIWVKNSSGEYIRTMKLMAQQRKQYLYSWIASSNQDIVNAVTGPTLTNHQTHVISWNCTDNNGNILPDGEYQFWIEYTDQHAQGPISNFTFNKSTSSIHTDYTDETYFKDLSIVYEPVLTSTNGLKTNEAKVYQDPSSRSVYFSIPTVRAENALLQIYSDDGKKIFETLEFIDNGQFRVFKWFLSTNQASIFIYRIENGAVEYKGKFIF
jgi:hypothetical protein